MYSLCEHGCRHLLSFMMQGGNNNQVEIKVQLNLSLKIDCNEHLSLEDFQERIRRQAASKSVEMRYLLVFRFQSQSTLPIVLSN